MYYRGYVLDHIVTSYSSPVPGGKEKIGGDDKAAGFDARETVAVESW